MHGPGIGSNARSLVLGLTGIGEEQGSRSDSQRKPATLPFSMAYEANMATEQSSIVVQKSGETTSPGLMRLIVCIVLWVVHTETRSSILGFDVVNQRRERIGRVLPKDPMSSRPE